VEFRVEVGGLNELVRALTTKAAELQVVTREATGLAAHIVERNTKDLLRQSSHPKGTPTPSPPGTPPSVVTGTLMRSITVEGPTGVAGTYRSQVGPTVIYGRIHELGGQAGRRNAARLPARPYLAPALAQSKDHIAGMFYAAWRGVFL
jgi:phage gpG-like protein